MLEGCGAEINVVAIREMYRKIRGQENKLRL